MAKRANGEGSVYKAKDGRWVAAVVVDGKRWVYRGKTRQEASGKLTDALVAAHKGLPLVPQKETVKAYLERWLSDVAQPSVRPSTYDSYEALIKLHAIPALGHIALAKLMPADVQALLVAKRNSGLSARRVQYLRACLRNALNQALKWGLVARNVAALTNPPKMERYEIRPWTADQARRFLDTAKDDRRHGLFVLALATGARQGELLALKWSDVDLDAGSIRITGTLQRIDGQFVVCPPKTQRSRRTIELPPSMVAVLHAHRARQLRERMVADPEWQDTGYVFTTAFGAPLDASTVTHRFQKLIDRANENLKDGEKLPRQRFHDLRHCCASFLLAAGTPARVVMELLGHSQISLTLNTYSHVIPSLQCEATDRLGAILASGG